jgi:hypothetical protein
MVKIRKKLESKEQEEFGTRDDTEIVSSDVVYNLGEAEFFHRDYGKNAVAEEGVTPRL